MIFLNVEDLNSVMTSQSMRNELQPNGLPSLRSFGRGIFGGSEHEGWTRRRSGLFGQGLRHQGVISVEWT